MNRTSISWVLGPDGAPGFTWNPFAGCTPISKGCAHCYASRLAGTRLAHLPAYAGLTKVERLTSRGHIGHWTGEVRFFAEKLAEPLRRRKPAGIFVGDMGDIALLTNEQIAAIFGVMAACPQHRFYVLTKRAKRMREWFEWSDEAAVMRSAIVFLDSIGVERGCGSAFEPDAWPLPNVFVGVSVCCRADLGNLDELRRIPAVLRFVSFEPLLEDLGEVDLRGISWAIPGGESGPKARPCHVEWIRSLVRQCRDAGVAPFVKQLGRHPIETASTGLHGVEPLFELMLRDRAGADMNEFPSDLKIRELPAKKGTRR